MNRAFGYGLVLLTATGTGISLAQGRTVSGEGIFLAISGSGSGSSSSHAAAQGYLGVDVRDISDEQLASLKLREARGAEIVLVDHDAPAGKIGLREHDVVLQMNGRAIESEEQVRRMLRESPPGRTVVLVISRDGTQISFTAQLANREDVERQAWKKHFTVPEPSVTFVAPQITSQADSDPTPSSSAHSPHGNSFIGTILMTPSYTGAMLEQMSPQLAQFFGAADGKGLLVRSIAANSPASDAGMQAGDFVVRADAKPIASSGDWSKAIKNCKGHSLSVVVLRDKTEHTLTLTPDGKKRSSLDAPESPTDSGPDGSSPSPQTPTVAHLGFSFLSHS